MSTFNYRLLVDLLDDRGFDHCKSLVFPLLDYQFIALEEVRKVDFCESVHDLTELYLSKTGQRKGMALEVYLSVIECYITSIIRCRKGSLADEYKHRALKMIKEIKGKASKDFEEKYDRLLTVFSIYLGLMRPTFPDFVKKEASDVHLLVNGQDEELLSKIKDHKVRKDFPIIFRKNTEQDFQENDMVYIHNCILYCNLMEAQGEYGRSDF